MSYLGHTVVENRNGLVVAAMATQADGTAEYDAGLLMVAELMKKRKRRITLGADKAYDTKDFVNTVREPGATPHVTQNNANRRSAMDGRTTRHPGYRVSLRKRWLVEKPFGWMKQIGGLRKVKLRGLAKIERLFVFTYAAYNLLRARLAAVEVSLPSAVGFGGHSPLDEFPAAILSTRASNRNGHSSRIGDHNGGADVPSAHVHAFHDVRVVPKRVCHGRSHDHAPTPRLEPELSEIQAATLKFRMFST